MKLQTRILPALAILALAPLVAAQETPEDNQAIPEWQQKIENLSPEQKEDYAKALSEGTRLFNQKRIFESLNQIYEAEKIFDSNPSALNLKGACYVEFRDFDRARACFNEALALAPKNPNVIFNLVEMDFVTKKWTDCQKRIATLVPLVPEENIAMHRLLDFKLLLSYLSTKEIDKARDLSNKQDFLDDNPYYYYANAAMAYHAGDAEKAESWINSARRVFRDDATLAPWQDSLIEFGYIKSFYGEDLDPNSPTP